MKRLLVMRHAKSDWNAGAPSDHARPLNERGRATAPQMGRLLTAIGEAPELVVSSTANRAHTTALLAADAGEWTAEVRTTDVFYNSDPHAMIGEIVRTPSEIDRLMVVGHQPTLSGLVSVLCGGSVVMKTATVAIVDLYLGGSWDSVEPPHGELITLLQPRHVSHLAI